MNGHEKDYMFVHLRIRQIRLSELDALHQLQLVRWNIRRDSTRDSATTAMLERGERRAVRRLQRRGKLEGGQNHRSVVARQHLLWQLLEVGQQGLYGVRDERSANPKGEGRCRRR